MPSDSRRHLSSKRSACDRCRRQKLGCEKRHGTTACNRCIRLKKNCVMSILPPLLGPLSRRVPLSLRPPAPGYIPTPSHNRQAITFSLSTMGSTDPVLCSTASTSSIHDIADYQHHVECHASQSSHLYWEHDHPAAITSTPQHELPPDFELVDDMESRACQTVTDTPNCFSSLEKYSWDDDLVGSGHGPVTPIYTECHEGPRFHLAEDTIDTASTGSISQVASTPPESIDSHAYLHHEQQRPHDLPALLVNLSKRSRHLQQLSAAEQEIPVAELLRDSLDDISDYCGIIRPYYHNNCSQLGAVEMLNVVSAYLEIVDIHDKLLRMLHKRLSKAANSTSIFLDRQNDEEVSLLSSIFLQSPDSNPYRVLRHGNRATRRRSSVSVQPSSALELCTVRLQVRMLMEDVLYQIATMEAILGLSDDFQVLQNKGRRSSCHQASSGRGVLNNQAGRSILAAASRTSCGGTNSTTNRSSIRELVREIHGILDTALLPC